MGTTDRRYWPLYSAAALFALSLLLFWPGIATYDTVAQYRQALSGVYDDWHPPVFARLWSLLLPLGGGTGPMLVLQLAGYWLGLGALAGALGGRKAWALLALGVFPPLLGWQGVVLKDSQLAGALLCAVGVVGWYRLKRRPLSWPIVLLLILCFGYATLLRANAAFSTVPLAVMLFLPRWPRRHQAALIVLLVPLTILAAQLTSRHLLGARDSGVGRVEALYDLGAIAVRTGEPTAAGLSRADVAALDAGHCIKPLFWDPMLGREVCVAHVLGLEREPPASLYEALLLAVARHPLAYLAHRAGHLNSTERWLVAAGWPLGSPPAADEPNDMGLSGPDCCLAARWQTLAAWLIETPAGWPVVWVLLGIRGIWQGLGAAPRSDRRDIALALFASALCQEASFAVLSISSDLRYHLWAMLAVALGWLVLWQRGMKWPGRTAFLLALGLVVVAGVTARVVMTPLAANYNDLLF